jgi:hypothetical protein
MKIYEQMFEGIPGAETLLVKAETLIEAEINERVADREKAIVADLDKAFAARQDAFVTESTENISKFLDVIVLEWAKTNAPAIDTVIKADLSTTLIQGMKSVFETANIALPTEGNKNLVAEVQAKLDEVTAENKDLRGKFAELNEKEFKRERQALVAQAVKGLADTKAARISKLVESLSFKNAEEFKEKLAIIVEAMGADGVDDGAKKGDDTPIDPTTSNPADPVDPVVKVVDTPVDSSNAGTDSEGEVVATVDENGKPLNKVVGKQVNESEMTLAQQTLRLIKGRK